MGQRLNQIETIKMRHELSQWWVRARSAETEKELDFALGRIKAYNHVLKLDAVDISTIKK